MRGRSLLDGVTSCRLAPIYPGATADFMARVWSDASYYIWALKFRFNRIRPYSLEPRLENLQTPNFPAYPSAHAANSYVAAFVYQELLPEHRELFLQNARDMAYSREILGVHFPSDSESGRAFARQLVDRLLQEPAFRADLEAAGQEIERVRRTAVSAGSAGGEERGAAGARGACPNPC